jgi:voltage-gated sodium channel
MIKPVGSPCREFCFRVATHTYFDVAILAAILLNSLGLCVKWPNMAEETLQTLNYINYFFTGVFCLEFVFKIFAFGTRYFKDNWNRFDFLIVVTSVTFIVIA